MIDRSNPYCFVNSGDIVPRVPPRILGYHDALLEYDLKAEPYIDFARMGELAFLRWLIVIVTGRFLVNHAMETYRRALRGSLPP